MIKDDTVSHDSLSLIISNHLRSPPLTSLQQFYVPLVLGCIKISMTSRVREVILPFYAALVGPHLESCIQLQGPQLKDMNLLVQKKATRMLYSIEKRRFRGDLIQTFQYLKGTSRKAGNRLFVRGWRDRTKGDDFKLTGVRF